MMPFNLRLLCLLVWLKRVKGSYDHLNLHL